MDCPFTSIYGKFVSHKPSAFHARKLMSDKHPRIITKERQHYLKLDTCIIQSHSPTSSSKYIHRAFQHRNQYLSLNRWYQQGLTFCGFLINSPYVWSPVSPYLMTSLSMKRILKEPAINSVKRWFWYRVQKDFFMGLTGHKESELTYRPVYHAIYPFFE